MASADEPDPNPANNTDDDGNHGRTGPSADGSLVKTWTTAGPFAAGQSVSYTLRVANAGPSTATNIDVTDTPSNLTITSVSGSGCVALPCTIASLSPGADTTIDVAATIDVAGGFDNAATSTAVEPDPNPANNTDDDGNGGTVAGAPEVDLAITKTSSLDELPVGEAFAFTLVIVNNGPDTATNVTLVDPLPTNFQLSSTTTTQGSCTGTTTVSAPSARCWRAPR
jgi:uncharacterized repeat protein (TIGR01451 family)